MAEVDIIPKIRCDNCGLTVEKIVSGSHSSRQFSKPRAWGTCKMEGGRSSDSYGGKARLDFSDLCQRCANAALDAAAAALEKARSEGFDGPTGAE
jgi:hypothetical protein